MEKLLSELCGIYGIQRDDLLFLVETATGEAYGSEYPAILLQDGCALVFGEKIKIVKIGKKNVTKIFKFLEKSLLSKSIEIKRKRLATQKLVFGRIEKKDKKGRLEVTLFEGISKGREVGSHIAFAIFDPKKYGIPGEKYLIGRHYLFSIRCAESTFILKRLDIAVIRHQVRSILSKVIRVLKKKISYRVVDIDMKNQSILIEIQSEFISIVAEHVSNEISQKVSFSSRIVPLGILG